jgi:hypothetical protein
MQIGLPVKSIAEYKKVKKRPKSVLAGLSALKSDQDSDEMDKDSSESDPADFSRIEIPSGIAPETAGQIFNALKQLETKTCKVYSERQKRLSQPSVIEVKMPKEIKPKVPEIVVSSAPKLRDLQKELVGMVPLSVQRKKLDHPYSAPVDKGKKPMFVPRSTRKDVIAEESKIIENEYESLLAKLEEEG